MVALSESGDLSFSVTVKKDLCRLARFGANISDAHSCFIFLPTVVLAGRSVILDAVQPSVPGGSSSSTSESYVELAGCHSLSREILHGCRLTCDSGLIGWVARHGKAIHVSPFERDSRTLGIYAGDQQLKSFIGIPVSLKNLDLPENSLSGVIACDSKKSFAFSKLQGKLIEDLSEEVANTLSLLYQNRGNRQGIDSWQDFLRGTIELAQAVGRDSLEILRLRLSNYDAIESGLGTADCIKLLRQMQRLIRQALPSACPLLELINGDIVIALDAMTSSYYENRITAICSHIGNEGLRPVFQFSRRSARDKRYRTGSIERVVADTVTFDETDKARQGNTYEYRRA